MMNDLIKVQEVVDFANANPVCHLATSENGQPHVRGMLVWRANERGIYFHTSKAKELYEQLVKNPKVEMAFLRTNGKGDSAALRIEGVAELVNDRTQIEELLEERPWLKAMGDTNDFLALFRVSNCKARFWDMSKNLKERSIEPICFGE